MKKIIIALLLVPVLCWGQWYPNPGETFGSVVVNGSLTLPGIQTTGTIANSLCADSSGHVIANASGNCYGGGGGGSVTSVALSLPSIFSVSGSPITGSGTLTGSFSGGQTANQILATPNGSSGALGLRSIVAADLPSTVPIYTNDLNGNVIGVLSATNVNGFYGFVPPTQDYNGIMAALRAAIASPITKNVLFEDATYNLGSNYIPLVGGIGYKGVPTRLGYANAGWVGKQHIIVGGSIFTGTGNYLFWDGATAVSTSGTSTVVAQTATTVQGSTSVTVTNGSLFTVGARVYVPQGQPGGGFYTGISYYVLSITGNVLTLGLPDMVAIQAASTATIQLSAGYPNDSTSRMSMTDIACDMSANASNINTICIKMGASNTFGPIYSDFKHIFVDGNHTGHALDITNYNQCTFDDIATNYGDGQYYNVDIPGTTGIAWEPGNSWFSRLFNSNNGVGDSNFLQHGLQFLSQNGALANEIQIESAQATTAYISTQTATTSALTNTSPNIPVPNSALWPVGLPIWISTGGNPNGFLTNAVYFVVSSAANVITISNQLGGTVVNSTGTATMAINSQGNSQLTIAAIGTGTVNNAHAKGLDLEGNSTALILQQRATVDFISTGQLEILPHVMLCARGAQGAFNSYSGVAVSTDFDSTSLIGFYGQRGTTYQGYYGYGIWNDTALSSSTYTLNLQPYLTDGFGSLTGVGTPTSSVGWIRAEQAIGEQIRTSDVSKTFGAINDAAWTVFNGATGQTYTLPVVSNASAQNTLVGMRFSFFNASANNLTVATQSSQTLGNLAAATSMTLGPQQWGHYTGAITSGGTLFWDVESNAGPAAVTTLTASGNITATGLLTSGTIANSLCTDSSGHIIANAGANCYSGGSTAWSSLTAPTTNNSVTATVDTAQTLLGHFDTSASAHANLFSLGEDAASTHSATGSTFSSILQISTLAGSTARPISISVQGQSPNTPNFTITNIGAMTFTGSSDAVTGVGGGAANLNGGSSASANAGGAVSLTAGSNSSTGPGGNITLTPGTSSSGTAGSNILGGPSQFGTGTLAVPNGGFGMIKISADGVAPGAAGAKFQVVCGTNSGTVKLVISAGTSATTITIVDNVGAGVTGC